MPTYCHHCNQPITDETTMFIAGHHYHEDCVEYIPASPTRNLDIRIYFLTMEGGHIHARPYPSKKERW